MIKNVFDRIEKKYLLSEETFDALYQDCLHYMNVDQYGLHTICNIYYDTDDYNLIRTSIEKPPYKEKFRVRSYGVPTNDSTIFMEIKKKYKGVVNKRREALDYKSAMGYLHRGIRPQKETQIVREIDFFLNRYDISPKVFLAYDRLALFGKEDNDFRVTFDCNIRYREHDLDLRKGSHGKMVLDSGSRLMEVKVSQSMPIWFVELLNKHQVYPTSFSKYGTVYKNELIQNQINNENIAEILSA